MMRRSPTSSPAVEAAAIGVGEVEAAIPSSRWKRLGALGIMLRALQVVSASPLAAGGRLC
jgi:hypothetical protein